MNNGKVGFSESETDNIVVFFFGEIIGKICVTDLVTNVGEGRGTVSIPTPVSNISVIRSWVSEPLYPT